MRTIGIDDLVEISGGRPSAGKVALVLELASDVYDVLQGFCEGVADGWNAESKG